MTAGSRLARPIEVMKFGGSSVADTSRLQRVADLVVARHREGVAVVVVVSAMGGTTDQLVGLAHEVSEAPDKRELDMLLTAGERISMSLLAIAICDRGVQATSLTGSQAGILTNDQPGGARVVEVRPYRVEDALARGHVVIVAGYQGVSYRREVTTLGRGGSDTTAVALAASLGARSAAIYSDVDGVYTADPRVVVDARRLAALSYDEMLALARAGAKVLAEDAVAYARAHGVRLYARATDGRPGETMVRVDGPSATPQLVGVGARAGAVLLQRRDVQASALPADGVLVAQHQPGAGALVLLARPVADSVDPAFERRVAGLVTDGWQRVAAGSFVQLVGADVGRDPTVPSRALAALAETGLAPRWTHQAALCWGALVRSEDEQAATRALHGLLGALS